MDRKKLVLAALAAAKGHSYSPVQIQKLMFLIDENLSAELGKTFSFKPCDYGPYDQAVYRTLDGLIAEGAAYSDHNGQVRQFGATALGMPAAEQALHSLRPETQQYIISLSQWVRSLSFADLVSAIYKHYPAMKVNSVFNG